MLKLLQRSALIVAGLYLTACSSVTVTTDYDHSTSFAQYKTYTLAPATEETTLSPSGEEALRNTLRTNLASRGITETNENADLHIVRHLSSKEKIAVYQSNQYGYAGVPYRYGRYGGWAGAPSSYTDVSQYTEGTLVLDFVDAKTKKLVFRGVGTGTIGDPESNAQKVKEVVEKMIQDFPGAVAH